MPWQPPGTCPKPSLKALQEAPRQLAVDPRARETENQPVILPVHGRLRFPPVSDSGPCFQPLGQSLSPSAAQRVPLGLAPERSLCHTRESMWTVYQHGKQRPWRAWQGLPVVSGQQRRPRAQEPPTVTPGRVKGECWGVSGQSRTAHCPRAPGHDCEQRQGWAGSDTKDTPHTQQTCPLHTCWPLSSQDIGVNSGTLSSSHRGGNKVTMYPRIPG